MRRRTKIILGVLVGLPVLSVGAALLVVPRVDLGPMVAARASAALGREVTVGSLHVSPGLTTAVALRGARLANIEGGTRPAMAEVARLDATLDLLALLRGEVVLRDAAADGFVLYLERAPGRRANWHFGDRPATPAPPGAAPADRSGFPVFRSLRLTRSEVVFRTTGGTELRTGLDEVTLAAAGVDQPTALHAKGSYNGEALTLEGALGSIATLRDAATPFPVTLRATARDTSLLYEGTSTDPLNVDGMDGRLTLAASTPKAILAMAGAAGGPEVPAEIAGHFTRQGDVWRLAEASGTLDGAALTAPMLELTEGGAGEPDTIVARLAVARLDLGRLAGESAGVGEDMALGVPAMPDPLVRAEISAAGFSHPALSGTDAEAKLEVAPGRIRLDTRFVALGARIGLVGEALPAGNGARLSAGVQMREADIDRLRRALGVHAVPVGGRLSIDASLFAEAATLGAIRRVGRVSAVAGMTGGSIAREVIEMASTDLRALFRTSRGTTRVTCLLAAVTVNGTRGEAAPLRIRAGTGTIAGIATFDLGRRWLDLVIGSERASTDFFALDIPVRVSGSFENPNIVPARWSREGRARLERGGFAPLPPDLMAIARRNPCYAGRSLRR